MCIRDDSPPKHRCARRRSVDIQRRDMKTIASILITLTAALGLATAQPKPMNTSPAPSTNALELATFGGGCFWCVEAVYEGLDGVRSVTSGYAGGKTDNPTYKDICTGLTGHAEVIQIAFDPAKISYDRLLEIFWQAHDPTTLNRQGADTGTQYRSVIFHHSPAQKAAAVKSRDAAQKDFPRPIVTEISALPVFFPAEDYHQDYYANNSRAGYCQVVIRPKLDKLRAKGMAK
jgi:peptide-methionine (S)-S-oxide reductase